MASIHVLSGTRQGEEVILRGDDLLVGRGPGCDVQLVDPEVSTRHARVQRRGRRWTVEDLESTNGTRVNGIEVSRAVLEDGDQIAFGPVVVVFQIGVLQVGAAPQKHDGSAQSATTTATTDDGNAAPSFSDDLTLHETMPEPTNDASSRESDGGSNGGSSVRSPGAPVRELSRDGAVRLRRLLDRTRRDAEALDAWVSDCALFVRALRLVDWTRLEPDQQRMIRELVDETEPEAVLRNMRASLASARESLRLASATAQALEVTAEEESPLPLRQALIHARALTDADALALTPVHGCDDEVLPLPPEAAIRLLRLLATIAERSQQGLALRVSEDATGFRLHVDGAPAGLAVLYEDTLVAIDELVTGWMGELTLRSEPRGTAVEIRLPG